MNRYGERWNDNEEKNLLKNIKIKSINDIAIEHGRTESAITCRLKYISVRMYNNGNDIKDIIDVTNLKEEVILYSIEKNKKKQLTTPENVTMLQNRIIKLLEEKILLKDEINNLKMENLILKKCELI